MNNSGIEFLNEKIYESEDAAQEALENTMNPPGSMHRNYGVFAAKFYVDAEKKIVHTLVNSYYHI